MKRGSLPVLHADESIHKPANDVAEWIWSDTDVYSLERLCFCCTNVHSVEKRDTDVPNYNLDSSNFVQFAFIHTRMQILVLS
jgi:hypothetical protein